MRLLKVKINNYRQFHGLQDLTLSSGGQKNISVIIGVNGAGKSNLFGAIHWCLYGFEPDKVVNYKKNADHVGLLNERVFEGLRNGETAPVTIQLFLSNQNSDITIKRSRVIEKISDLEDRQETENLTFMTRRTDGRGWHAVEDSSLQMSYINSILPSSISHFFFFDGEKLAEFFEPERNQKIRQEVERVSQVDIVDRSIKRLKTIRSDFRTSGDFGSEIAGLEKSNVSLNGELEKKQMNCEELENEIKGAKIKIDRIGRELHKFKDIKVATLQERRENLENENKSHKKRIEGYLIRLKNLSLDIVPLINIKSAAEELMHIVGKLEDEGKVPPNVDPGFINELLAREECICGRNLYKNSSEYQKIKSYSDTDKFVYGKHLIEIKSYLSSKLDGLGGFPKTVKEIYGDIEEETQSIIKKEGELKDISQALQGVDVEKVTSLESQRNELNDAIARQSFTVGEFTSGIKSLRKKIRENEKKIGQLYSKQKVSKEKRKRFEILDTSIQTLEEIKGKIVQTIKDSVQESTKKYFFDLIWKKEQFNDVIIDDDFNVSLKRKSGRTVDPSYGEGQILALSFIGALNNISGFNAPVIIDTPLGRISSENRASFAECLPKFLSDSQVTLLFTDTEYTEEVRKILQPSVSDEFELLHTDGEDMTQISALEYD